jgi:hypothetical protein
MLSSLEYRAEHVDPHTELTRELVAVQIQTWLHEARAADIRAQLATCRLRRAVLGRAYRRLVQTTTTAERA